MGNNVGFEKKKTKMTLVTRAHASSFRVHDIGCYKTQNSGFIARFFSRSEPEENNNTTLARYVIFAGWRVRSENNDCRFVAGRACEQWRMLTALIRNN